jgi:antitoxin MazE
MRTKIVKIGNSHGVRIPKSVLEEAGITAAVELTVVDGEIRISAVEPDSGAAFMIMSESSLSDWNRPEEDEAWAFLQ